MLVHRLEEEDAGILMPVKRHAPPLQGKNILLHG